MLRLPKMPWRRGGPDPDAAYAVLVAHGIAYGRIPKAGNSQMRRRLIKAAGLGRPGKVNRDVTWADPEWAGTALLTGRALTAAHSDAYVFTVVRNPFGRLVSCWRSKVVVPDATPLGGPFRPGMAFDAFVAAAVSVPDGRADVHIRSQSALLFGGGRPPSLDVFRLETLTAEWDRLAAACAARGLDLGPARENHVSKSPQVPATWTAAGVRAVRARYADDFAAFYPDAADPV